MKELTLLADSRAPLAFHLETSAAVAHWNLRDVPGDHISLPALCDARLTESGASTPHGPAGRASGPWRGRCCTSISRPGKSCPCGGVRCSTSAIPR